MSKAKLIWPEPDGRIARRIAALANAARGESVLLIIGLDEKTADVRSPLTQELSSWWHQLQTRFNGVVPRLVLDVNVPIGDEVLVALLFETSEDPYVVKVEGSGPVDREVPWREGTSVRSATQEDLLRILVPLSRAPRIEILEGHLVQRTPTPITAHQRPHLYLELLLYVVPRSADALVIPRHRANGRLSWPGGEVALVNFQFGAWDGQSRNIVVTENEFCATGPGAVKLTCAALMPKEPIGPRPVDFLIHYQTTDEHELLLNRKLSPFSVKRGGFPPELEWFGAQDQADASGVSVSAVQPSTKEAESTPERE